MKNNIQENTTKMIEGKKVNLRTVRKSDLETLFSLESSVKDKGDFDGLNSPSIVDWEKDYEKDGMWSEKKGIMLVTDKSNKIIGLLEYHKANYYTGLEAGYIIYRKNDRGKGYMSEAFKIFTSFIFGCKNIPRIYLHIVPENIASIKLAEKVGYKREGVMRDAVYIRGRHHDFAFYSMLKEECPSFEDVIALL
jgi:RimJ/RimL family protein N-acetyltransferase